MPKAVENTINAVVKAFIDPICLTPYISAQVDDPRTLARPLEMPIKPKKINISCDFNQINRLFMNILKNSIESNSKKKKKVHITVSKKSNFFFM